MTAPRFAAVITNYNYRRFVGEAIESALDQSFAAAEVIVVDDGSTDDSAEWLTKTYGDDSRVRILTGPNRGHLGAVATGIAASTAPWIALLDADDAWLPNYLERLAATLNGRPAIDFIYTNMRYFGSREGIYLPPRPSRDLGLSILLGAFRTEFQGTATSALCFRRAVADRALDLPADLIAACTHRADYAFVVGSDVHGFRKYYLAEALVQYRAHGHNHWLGKHQETATNLKQWLLAQAMVDCFRQNAHLSLDSLTFTKHEFRTKPKPDWIDLKRYWSLLSRAPLSWGKRWEHRISLLSHYLRQRNHSTEKQTDL